MLKTVPGIPYTFDKCQLLLLILLHEHLILFYELQAILQIHVGQLSVIWKT